MNESQRPPIPVELQKRGFYYVQPPWVRGGYAGDFCYYSAGSNKVYVNKEGYELNTFLKMWDEDREKRRREYIKYKLEHGILSK